MGVDSSAVTSSHDYKFTHLPTQVQNWDAGGYEVRAQTFQSDVSTGTAPFIVASTTVVTNLNADKLDGNDASDLGDFVSGDIMLSTNSSPQSGWTDVSATYNNKFIRISSGSPTSTGGADTHTHGAGSLVTATHNHGGNTGSTVPAGSLAQAGSNHETAGTHSHTISSNAALSISGTSASGDNVPAYVQLRTFQKD